MAVVERFRQESTYGLSAGTKKVALVERWPLVEVRLYEYLIEKGNQTLLIIKTAAKL